jgi:Dyp-type peroxidase family
MAKTPLRYSSIDYSDIQSLVRYGHGHLKEACFLLLKVENLVAARSWLATAPVTNAAERKSLPATALQIAFTCQGLQSLGVPDSVIKGFSPEFVSGMVGEESRSRRLGDTGASAPSRWQWGSPGNTPDVLLMLYAKEGQLEEWKETVVGRSFDTGFQLLDCLDTEDLDSYEPFGFRDGISQPKIDWNRERDLRERNQLEYENLIALGEVLLGYPNEYGKYTDRPLVDPTEDAKEALLSAEDQSGKRDWGLNGTYLVFRQLQQDVPGFWQFLDKQANTDPAERRKLAESLVGRTMSGEPLAPPSDRTIAGVGPGPNDTKLNQFTYDSDNDGTRCPFGSHVRRANPRNADLPGGARGVLSRWVRILGFGRNSIRDDLIASTRFHRLLRRGREYGTELPMEDALLSQQPVSADRGIHFICLNANIARQFEFVQNAWIMGTKFDGLTEESDPLLGNRQAIPGCPATNLFSIPQENGVRRRISGMPQFVTVRGGAYFFLPSLRALKYLASLGD